MPILLVRHGESVWNAEGRWQGHGDPPLSDRGRAQAAGASEGLAGFDGAIVASTLRRARETAEIIAGGLGAEVSWLSDDLREIDIGVWTGLTTEQIDERYPGARMKMREGINVDREGGEPLDVFRARVVRGVRAIAERYGERDVLAVTHGGFIHNLERILDVHPGEPLGNLQGRRFAVTGDEIRPVAGRLDLLASG